MCRSKMKSDIYKLQAEVRELQIKVSDLERQIEVPHEPDLLELIESSMVYFGPKIKYSEADGKEE